MDQMMISHDDKSRNWKEYKKKRREITPGGGGWFEMCVDVSLQEHLGSESLGAAVDDALERLVVAVVRQNMFLKP